MKQYLLIRNLDTKKYIALDYAYGGYPYEVDSPFEAKIWSSEKALVDYAESFQNKNWVMVWVNVEVRLSKKIFKDKE